MTSVSRTNSNATGIALTIPLIIGETMLLNRSACPSFLSERQVILRAFERSISVCDHPVRQPVCEIITVSCSCRRVVVLSYHLPTFPDEVRCGAPHNLPHPAIRSVIEVACTAAIVHCG